MRTKNTRVTVYGAVSSAAQRSTCCCCFLVIFWHNLINTETWHATYNLRIFFPNNYDGNRPMWITKKTGTEYHHILYAGIRSLQHGCSAFFKMSHNKGNNWLSCMCNSLQWVMSHADNFKITPDTPLLQWYRGPTFRMKNHIYVFIRLYHTENMRLS